MEQMITEEDPIDNMHYFFDKQDDLKFKYTWKHTQYFLFLDIEELHKRFCFLLIHFKMYAFMENSYIIEQNNNYLKYLNICLNILTIVCWTYIIYLMFKNAT